MSTATVSGSRSSTTRRSRSHCPLPHQLGSPPGGGIDRVAREHRLVQSALRRPAQRQALDALRRPAVVEDVDGAAPRGEGRRRHERPEHRVLVVLPHRDDPHPDPVLAHQPRQHRIEPVAQPLLLDRRLLAQRAERLARSGAERRGRRRLQQQQGKREMDHAGTGFVRVGAVRAVRRTRSRSSRPSATSAPSVSSKNVTKLRAPSRNNGSAERAVEA